MSLKNWNKEANGWLVLAMSIVGTLTAFSNEVINILHEAPFPVPASADHWIQWLLKVATLTLSIITVFTKRTESTTTITNDAA